MEAPAVTPDKQALERNIERTVDKTALRKLRNLVDNFDADERARKNHQLKIMAVTVLVLLGLLFAGYFWRVPSIKNNAGLRAERVSSCYDASIQSQRSVAERDWRTADPQLSAEAIERRLQEYREVFDTRARNACGKRA